MDERFGTDTGVDKYMRSGIFREPEVEYPSRVPPENKEAAADWLKRRILEAITETERKYGVYIAKDVIAQGLEDFWFVNGMFHIWPEAMRIIEPEPTSIAIG